MPRETFARLGLEAIPKILTLQDRNRHGPTYGCFDRNHWLHRIVDFPTGMAQEFVWPLALAHSLPIDGNPYHRNPALRDWVEAGIRYAMRSAHADGSCDDFFPYERALGATAFAQLACVESMLLLGIADPDLLEFAERRGRWLANREESGRLGNHEALVAFGLLRLARLLGKADLLAAADARVARLLSRQHAEGWFWEYEGCDLGYQTITMALLADYHRNRPGADTAAALERALAFIGDFVYPDGSFGGEIGSRDTYNFFPHGFEIMGAWQPAALTVNDRIAAGIEAGLGHHPSDDRIIGHHAWSQLLAWRDYVAERPAIPEPMGGRVHYRGAGLLVDRRHGSELFVALNKGGVFKLFRDGKLAVSDTQISMQVRERPNKPEKTAVCHLIDDYEVSLANDRISVGGRAGWAKQRLMGVRDSLILRVFMIAIGRAFPDLVRRILQRMLIAGKRPAPFRFTRDLRWVGGEWLVTDTIDAEEDWAKVTGIGLEAHQTSVCVIQSRTFQAGQLIPWLELSHLKPGSATASFTFERRL